MGFSFEVTSKYRKTSKQGHVRRSALAICQYTRHRSGGNVILNAVACDTRILNDVCPNQIESIVKYLKARFVSIEAHRYWNMKRSPILLLSLILMSPLRVGAADVNSSLEVGATMVADWNDLAIEWVRQSERGPTISMRFVAYVNLALFDAWAAFDDNASGIVTDVKAPRYLTRFSNLYDVRTLTMALAAHQTINEVGASILKQDYLEIGVGENAAERLEILMQSSDDILDETREHLERFRLRNRKFAQQADAVAQAIADEVAAGIRARALTDGANQQNDYRDTTGYAPTAWATPVPAPSDGISNYDFSSGYTFWAFNLTDALSYDNSGPISVHPGVASGAIRLTETWQSLTELGVFPPADDGGPQVPLTPHWGNVTPIVLSAGSQLRPSSILTPYDFAGELDPQWIVQATQLVEFASKMQDGAEGGALQRARSEYWELGDATEYPPGWWHQRATDLARDLGLSPRDTIKLLLTVSIAEFDSTIASWDTKFAFDSVRPITAVNELFFGSTVSDWRGNQVANVDDRDHWRPYQLRRNLTPPFPDVVSGHSTFSAAASTVMMQLLNTNLFGYETEPFVSRFDLDDGFDGDPGNGNTDTQTLYWPYFSASAEEAGLSRLYGGIHMMDGNLKGLTMGTQIGHMAIGFVNEKMGDGTYHTPSLVFGTGEADDHLLSPAGVCGAIELYGFHGADLLEAGSDTCATVYLFGGEGNDTFQVNNHLSRGRVWIRDYEPGEIIKVTGRHYGLDSANRTDKIMVVRRVSAGREWSSLLVNGWTVARLDGHWTLEDLSVELLE